MINGRPPLEGETLEFALAKKWGSPLKEEWLGYDGCQRVKEALERKREALVDK